MPHGKFALCHVSQSKTIQAYECKSLDCFLYFSITKNKNRVHSNVNMCQY
jgi:hypothetical protein